MGSFREEYRKIRHGIILTRNPLKGITSLFVEKDISYLKMFAEPLCREKFVKDAIYGIVFPKEISYLGRCGNMPYFGDLNRSLLWYFLSLRGNSEYINSFLRLKSEFEQLFIFGYYEQCLDILDKSTELFGYSLWSILNRIFLINETKGLENQKDFTNRMLTNLKQGNIEQYLVYFYSRQCETNVSVGTYMNNINNEYKRFVAKEFPIHFCRYVKYKLNGYLLSSDDQVDYLNNDTVSYFLFMDDKNALIDRYLSFCAIVSTIAERGEDTLLSMFIPYLIDLNKSITDPLLTNTVYMWQNQYCYNYKNGNDRICKALDEYSCGNYNNTLSQVSELLRENINYFPLVEIYAKSCVYLGEYSPLTSDKSTIETIINKLRLLFSHTGDIKEITTDLIKLLYTHLDSTWAKELLVILNNYISQQYSFEPFSRNSIHSCISTPDDIFSFDVKYLNTYLDEAAPSFQNCLTTKFAIAVRMKNIDALDSLTVEETCKMKYKAKLLVETAPKEAIRILENIRDKTNCLPVCHAIDSLLILSYLSDDEPYRAMEYFLSAYFENSNFVYFGHIGDIYGCIKSSKYNLSGSILTPIVCNIYNNNYASENEADDILLSTCYDEYLAANHVQKPSELLQKLVENNSNNSFYAIYFYSEVCVPNVMDRSLAFDTYDDVLSERIVICTALTTIDPTYREKYIDEIHRLTNNLMTRLAKREVEYSKIYTDISGIRTLLGKEICELYERYTEFRENNINEQVVQVLNAVNDMISTSNSRIIYVTQNVGLDAMLKDIILRIRDIFIADNKYGLDGYLSVRIRHGTLESQLRCCFEKHYLITTKTSDGLYHNNQHWIKESARNCDSSIIEQIHSIFAQFSKDADSLIGVIKGDLIQINTEDNRNERGLFNFALSDNDFAAIKSRIQLNASFEQFETIVLDYFLDITDESLTTIRQVLESDINDQFQRILNRLLTEMQNFSDYINITRLSDQIATARTDISNELKTISEWFRLTRPDSFQDYQLSLAASISCSIMQNINREFEYDISGIDEQIRLKGSTLPSVVDIFNILLDNVIKHSGVAIKPYAKVRVQKDSRSVIISVENPVQAGSVNEKDIESILLKLRDWEKVGIVSQEGGSGLYKIEKILSVDLKCHGHVDIQYENDSFLVIINTELDSVLL